MVKLGILYMGVIILLAINIIIIKFIMFVYLDANLMDLCILQF
jgi:hypothetical protein